MGESSGQPTLTRGHKKKARTRHRLVAAAVDVIAEQGEKFSVSDIVDRAGVSNGTFYNYFTDRDELIDAVVPEVLASFGAESATAVVSEDPAMRFATISALVLATAAGTPDGIRAVLRLDAVQQAIIEGEVTKDLHHDLVAGVSAGRFTMAPGSAAVEASIDVVVGSLLLAARRIVDGGVDEGYGLGIVTQLLCSLGVGVDEATGLARLAVDEAGRITKERQS